MLLDWKGDRLIAAASEASRVATRETAQRAVSLAETHHPWHDITGAEEADIGILRVDAKEGGLVQEVEWGDSSDHALYLEVGTVHARPFPYLRPAQDEATKELAPLLATTFLGHAFTR